MHYVLSSETLVYGIFGLKYTRVFLVDLECVWAEDIVYKPPITIYLYSIYSIHIIIWALTKFVLYTTISIYS